MDTGAAHALLLCPWGGHAGDTTLSSSLLHAAAQQCDHTSEMEVPGPHSWYGLEGPLTSSPRLWAMLTLPWMSPFAPRTPSEAGVDCTQSRVQAKLQHYGPPPGHSSPPKHLIFPQSSGAPTGDLTPIRWPFLRSLSKSIARKTQTLLRPRLSFTGCTPVSLLRSGDALHVRFVPAGR